MQRKSFFKSLLTLIAAPSLISQIDWNDMWANKVERLPTMVGYEIGCDQYAIESTKGDIQVLSKHELWLTVKPGDSHFTISRTNPTS